MSTVEEASAGDPLFFAHSDIINLTSGSKTHEYATKKVSKDQLAEAVNKLSEGLVAVLKRTNEQDEEISALRNRCFSLETSRSEMEARVDTLEKTLGETRDRLAKQETAFRDERQKTRERIYEWDRRPPTLDLGNIRFLKRFSCRFDTIGMFALWYGSV